MKKKKTKKKGICAAAAEERGVWCVPVKIRNSSLLSLCERIAGCQPRPGRLLLSQHFPKSQQVPSSSFFVIKREGGGKEEEHSETLLLLPPPQLSSTRSSALNVVQMYSIAAGVSWRFITRAFVCVCVCVARVPHFHHHRSFIIWQRDEGGREKVSSHK